MSSDALDIDITAVIPKGLDRLDFDRKAVMRVLRAEARKAQKVAKSLVGSKRRSAPGQAPGMLTGTMRRNIKVKANGKAMWARVQVSTFRKDQKGAVWYPAVLNKGSAKRGIAPRMNPIERAADTIAPGALGEIEKALWGAIKGWK